MSRFFYFNSFLLTAIFDSRYNKLNENILVERCVIWCDWGRALEIGAETNAPEYRNIIFRDCDIIHGSSVMMDIQHHNRAEIHHILFDDIRAGYTVHQLPEKIQEDMDTPYCGKENVSQPRLISIPICDGGLFSPVRRNGNVHDVLFRNIKVIREDGVPDPISYFTGTDPEHTVVDVTTENVTVNGRPSVPIIRANEFTRNIRVAGTTEK